MNKIQKKIQNNYRYYRSQSELEEQFDINTTMYGGLITLYNADFSVCLHPVIGAPSIPQ